MLNSANEFALVLGTYRTTTWAKADVRPPHSRNARARRAEKPDRDRRKLIMSRECIFFHYKNQQLTPKKRVRLGTKVNRGGSFTDIGGIREDHGAELRMESKSQQDGSDVRRDCARDIVDGPECRLDGRRGV